MLLSDWTSVKINWITLSDFHLKGEVLVFLGKNESFQRRISIRKDKYLLQQI